MHHEHIRTALIDSESMPWMPFAPHADDVRVKLFRADPLRGEVVLLLKVPPRARMPRHRHSGPLMVYTIAGRWKYREHDWIAGTGSVVFAPAATSHTPQAIDPDTEILTLNVVNGDVTLLGPRDEPLATENWRSMLDRYLSYCAQAGVVPHDVTAFH